MKIHTNKGAVAFLKTEVPRRLFPNDVEFTHISFVNGHRVAFRMAIVNRANEVFGLAPVPTATISATSYYEMDERIAACSLNLTVTLNDQDYHYEYLLTGDERVMLTKKMESFFFHRIGTDLRAFSMAQAAEQVAPS